MFTEAEKQRFLKWVQEMPTRVSTEWKKKKKKPDNLRRKISREIQVDSSPERLIHGQLVCKAALVLWAFDEMKITTTVHSEMWCGRIARG